MLRRRRNVPATVTDLGPLHLHVADILRVPTATITTIAAELAIIALAGMNIVGAHHLCGITTIGIDTVGLRHAVAVLQWMTMARHEADMLMMGTTLVQYHLVAVMILIRI